MTKVIKEIIIMLLVCLVALLLLAVVFYEYIPARKNVAEVVTYVDNKKISDLLADDIDQKDKDVLITYEEGEYEVTSTDLKNYEVSEKYVPGKANPFAPVSKTESSSKKKKDSTKTSDNTKSNDNKSGSSSSSDKDTDDAYIKDKGTK